MRRIRWLGVVLGSVATVMLASVLLTFTSLVLEPFVSTLTGTAPVGGVTSTTVAEERVRGLLMGVSVISALLLAFLVGGLVVGRFAISDEGLNGAVMAVVVLVAPFVWLLGSMVCLFGPCRKSR